MMRSPSLLIAPEAEGRPPRGVPIPPGRRPGWRLDGRLDGRRLLVGAALVVGASAAQALCLPAVCSCTATTTNLLFGNYNPLAFGNTDTTGSVTVKCSGVAGLLIPFTIELGKGGGTSASNRRLAFSTYQLSYNLYSNAAYTSVWGDGNASTVLVSGSLTLDLLGLSPGLSYTVYGRIPGRQLTAAPGVYTDSVTVTVTYL
ncbi:Csu type fimbrial protein [Roseateles amylovorans]|uniref:Spore coat U domain-containing protein n=1 Tax=Roseateles amylovorans TaxID=2978473 RepID=A0ABY6AXJ2_9BURK|nr:spore coat U domain-containing protein [Roseateles amylovorans]UXH77697.1 spore coat U domain-containing protein [Roseateles amylovorans]